MSTQEEKTFQALLNPLGNIAYDAAVKNGEVVACQDAAFKKLAEIPSNALDPKNSNALLKIEIIHNGQKTVIDIKPGDKFTFDVSTNFTLTHNQTPHAFHVARDDEFSIKFN